MATLAPTTQWIKGAKDDYRTCPVTTLKVDLHSERLIIANAVMAVVCLALGGIAALLIALTRWQAIHLLDAAWFYRLLTLHGIDMLVAWIVFFEMAGLHFGSTILLNARQANPKLAWFGFILMTVGGLLANGVVLFDSNSIVTFTAYVPLKAHPLFYLSYILFAVGALITVITFFINLVVAKREGRFEGSLPLVVFGLMTAAILATYTLLQGAAAIVPAFFWSLGMLPEYDPGIYRNFFCGFCHPAQQVNLAAMVAILFALAQMTLGIRPLNEKFSRLAFILYLFFINLGSAHHLLVDPGLSFAWKAVNTSYAMYLAVLGSMMHAFSIPAAMEVAQRAKGFTKGFIGRRIRVRSMERTRILRPRDLNDPLWLDRRNYRGDHRHGTDQHAGPQHPAIARSFPRDGGRRNHDRLHGLHLLCHSADLPKRVETEEMGAMAAIRLWCRIRPGFVWHDHQRTAGRFAAQLGHHLRRCRPRNGRSYSGHLWHWRPDRRYRRHHVPDGRPGLGVHRPTHGSRPTLAGGWVAKSPD